MDRPPQAASEPTRSPISLALEEDDRARGGFSGANPLERRATVDKPPVPDPAKKPRRNQSYSNLQSLTKPPVPTGPKPASKRRSLPAMSFVSPRVIMMAATQKEDPSRARPPAVSQPAPPVVGVSIVLPHSNSDSMTSITSPTRRNSNAVEPKPLQISAPTPRSNASGVSTVPSTPEKKSSFFGFITKKSSSSLRDLAIGDDVWMQTVLRPTGIWQQHGKGSFILPAVSPIPLRVCEQWCYEAGRSSATLIGPFELVEEERANLYFKDFLLPHRAGFFFTNQSIILIIVVLMNFYRAHNILGNERK